MKLVIKKVRTHFNFYTKLKKIYTYISVFTNNRKRQKT